MTREDIMSIMSINFRRVGVSLAELVLSSSLALAQSKVTLAVGGGARGGVAVSADGRERASGLFAVGG